MNGSALVDFALKNPDRVILALLTVVTFVLRFAKPGSRVQAFCSSLSVDLVKSYCVVAKKPLPGGFSPAPAEIPPTNVGAANTATPPATLRQAEHP